MASPTPLQLAIQRLRRERHGQRLAALEAGVNAILSAHPSQGAGVALFGSLARDDWDGFSDVDLLVLADQRADAEALAEALLAAGLGHDVLAFDRPGWQRRRLASLHWAAIAREAKPLAGVWP